jgi:hypothetical protein
MSMYCDDAVYIYLTLDLESALTAQYSFLYSTFFIESMYSYVNLPCEHAISVLSLRASTPKTHNPMNGSNCGGSWSFYKSIKSSSV